MTALDFIKEIDFRPVLSNPILDIGAQVLNNDQYEAFQACYFSLRVMDDMVDDRKAGKGYLSSNQKREITQELGEWIRALESRRPIDATQSRLMECIESFQIPIWPWVKFAASMRYDLDHNGFATFLDFLRYSEGAAIAPGVIYMQLCAAISPNSPNGTRVPASFDIRKTARPLAIYSYLVHIFRDFQEDQNNRMNYFADDLIQASGASHAMLRDVAAGADIDPAVRALMGAYYRCAEFYRHKARAMLDGLPAFLEPRDLLSLEIIFSQYQLIFEKIDIQNGNFTSVELLPSPEEVLARVHSTIGSFEDKLLFDDIESNNMNVPNPARESVAGAVA